MKTPEIIRKQRGGGPSTKAGEAVGRETFQGSRGRGTCGTAWKAGVLPVVLLILLLTASCTRMLTSHYGKSLMPKEGKMAVEGLTQPVTVSRDNLGIPFIEAATMTDLAFAIGYVNASDRLTQMIGLKLVSQGRLSEMAGTPALDLDIFMRTVNLAKSAQVLYDELSPERKELLEWYARGVNAYLDSHRSKLPPELDMSAYTPDRWEVMDSICIMALVNFALSFNLHEEISSLSLAQAIGSRKAAWLHPIHPDEPLPFDEGQKLEGVDLKGTLPQLKRVSSVGQILAGLGLTGIAASNNWAVAKERTARGASILANDTHLYLTFPSLWNMMHVRCGDLDAAGVGVAGLPTIVAGYNGHIAWGMTMVMADNQDVFLERMKVVDGRLCYLYKDAWFPVKEREEVFRVKGKGEVRVVVRETAHGPLLNDVVKNDPTNMFLPDAVELPLGIALSWGVFERGDKSLDSFFSLSRARSVQEAIPLVRGFEAMALNMVIADRDNIAWQVTGRYPVRAKGRGLLPSPGWTGEYDWKGFLPVDQFPGSFNPPEGYIGTANNKSVPSTYPYILSSSWYWPDRANRIRDMITSTQKHTIESSKAMQLDAVSITGLQLRKLLLEGDFSASIRREIDSWSNGEDRELARQALAILQGFDGNMQTSSTGASLVGAFTHALTRDLFLDELGPEDSRTWRAFVSCNSMSYNATSDHLFLRGDESPFWDNTATPQKETKVRIVAKSLAHAMDLLEDRLGTDSSNWGWGRLHTYHFITESTRMSPHLGLLERTALKVMSPYFNRGPFPAPGDYTTLNVSGTMIGKDFDTWLIPAMRLVVDFGLEEPFYGINSTGQSDNPSSPNYDDGVHAWLEGRYQPFPFKDELIRKQYDKVLIMEPK
ncbi:MAG TPA: penicillin acylase family protein [Deltaproteobacteria bacterium]|nr:penicillin acylase family protein [Deltaproteobacteria bacterium]HOI06948.1 penicillin acylase family protein [Deltaproteobacteria bacterium]